MSGGARSVQEGTIEPTNQPMKQRMNGKKEEKDEEIDYLLAYSLWHFYPVSLELVSYMRLLVFISFGLGVRHTHVHITYECQMPMHGMDLILLFCLFLSTRLLLLLLLSE